MLLKHAGIRLQVTCAANAPDMFNLSAAAYAAYSSQAATLSAESQSGLGE